ncbi:hypothetical protein A3Q56_00858 [Intoshia linei]|uniref:Acetyl-coenzyme A synthetase n=1 Tax=Intoshia linei TaxID=1819745 RepID=A0A177BAU3_9BILA|nr:hypothetical protein A3Q56_00858 [Intoshia linei]
MQSIIRSVKIVYIQVCHSHKPRRILDSLYNFKFLKQNSREYTRFKMYKVVDYVKPEDGKRELSCPFPEFENFKFEDKYKNLSFYQQLHQYSLDHNHDFWSTLAKSRLAWYSPYNEISTGSFKQGDIKWFLKGKINVSVNCLDRHIKTRPDDTALIWDKNEPGQQEHYSYKELLVLTCKIGNVFRKYDIKKGDVIAIYMPHTPLAVATMLACARIGAIHSVIFAGFSATALASRINDANAKAVVTCNEFIRGTKLIKLKDTVNEAVKISPSVKNIFVGNRTDSPFTATHLDVLFDKELELASNECNPEIMDSEDPLFILYTSGSTGKPKGLVHTQAGYLLYASVTHQMVFNYNKGEIYACMADIGWITGHSYVVYGPLCNGATSVIFESTPVYPDPGRYWETVQRLKINQIYVSPTALRGLLRHEESFVSNYDLSSLKCLGCVGEPLNSEAWLWYFKNVGNSKLAICDTWWQTETGGMMISPRPAELDSQIKVAHPMRGFFGIKPVIFDENGTCTELLKSGSLCIEKPWPGICRAVWGNRQRYMDVYFSKYPGFYLSGDSATQDGNKYILINGRNDDIINISGHRLGTAEVEDAINQHSSVCESAVVGYPHEIKGEAMFAFVILKENVSMSSDKIIQQLKDSVKKNIASFAVPHHILITETLPKTRSGKIMRRILKKVVQGKYNKLGDVTTLADSSSVDRIVLLHKEFVEKN